MNKRGLFLVFILLLGTLVFAFAGANEAQAAPPTFQAAGTAVNGTGNVSPAWPAHAIDDIALLFVETDDGDAITLSPSAGFVEVTNSPQDAPDNGTPGTRFTVFWARATSASMATPTVTGVGNHVYAQIITYRGVITTGDPWGVTGGGVKTTASTSVTVTGVTTTVADTLIVQAVARDNNSAAAAFSAETNANLTGIAERSDAGTTSGNGGGFGVWDGVKATIGATGDTTASVTSSINAFLTIALKPQPIVGAPTKLAFLQQPSNTVFNATINPAVTVEIQDASGNRVTSATNAVTIAIGTNPAGGTLSGTLTVNAVAGVATFSDLSINNPGNGYTFTASAAGLTGSTSAAFNIMTGGFGLTECAGPRYGSDLVCTAGDVSITGMKVVGDITSCVGGTSITIDLELSINFATPDRWDVGVFIANDGKDPQLLTTSGGATSCSVSILPPSSPFLDLDPGPWSGTRDICGDGNKNIGGGTGNGIHYMPDVTVNCQSLGGGGGNLYIPFVVSWDNQSSPSGATCTSNANPVPNTKSKCNAPTIAQGTVTVVVLPTISMTEPLTFVSSGTSVTYTVVITNTTGDTLTNALFKDPAVTGITANSVSCAASGGATCPGSTTVGGMQGAGLTIPSMPNGSSVTFTINATLTGNPGDSRTNTASVTVGSQTNSASDTDIIVGTIAIIPSTLSKYGTGTPSIWVVYNYKLYNFGGSSDTISLSAVSDHGWPVLIRNAADTATISSLTVPPAGSFIDFIIKVQIPAGTAIGTFDVTTITATSGNDPSKTATATANTTVLGPLTFTPDNTGSGGKSSSVFYDHRVQNNTASSQIVTFSTVLSGACTGWTVTPITAVMLAPFGGYEDIVVKVNIPSGAAIGDVCTATTTATASAGGYTASVIDITTVKDMVLYSDPGYTDESYIFPVGNLAYAKAFGLTNGTKYQFRWYDSSGSLRRTSPITSGVGTTAYDSYEIPLAGPLGTWRVELWNEAGTAIVLGPLYFYVGPDHLKASYTGPKPSLGANVIIPITLHDRYNHVVPMASGSVVQGTPPTTKDPLKVTITVSGSATIVTTTLIDAVISGQTVTGRLNPATGTATVTITDIVKETVTITPSSYNSALYGSPSRDESASVTFIWKRARIIDWREVVQ